MIVQEKSDWLNRFDTRLFEEEPADLAIHIEPQADGPREEDGEILRAIGSAFDRGVAFTLVESDGKLSLQEGSRWGDWCWSLMSSSQSLTNHQIVADFLMRIVKQRQSNTVKDNRDDYGLEVAKFFLKNVLANSESEISKALSKELIAARLGITSDIMDANPGFQDFAKDSHLYRYMASFGDSLAVQVDTDEIYIRREGTMQPWSSIAPDIRWEEPRQWIGFYDQTGIVNRSVFDWKKLKPYASEDPASWGYQYLLEIVVWTAEPVSLVGADSRVAEAPQMTNTHTFIRLKTPEEKDNVYSIGLTRPQKFSFWDHFSSPLSLRKGDLMSPDPTLFWGGRMTVTPFRITGPVFSTLVQKFEGEKAQGLPYHLRCMNCNEYAIDAARHANALLSGFISAGQLVLPQVVNQLANRVLGYLPEVLQQVALAPVTMAFNALTLFFGHGQVEAGMRPLLELSMQPLRRDSFVGLYDFESWFRVDQFAVNLFRYLFDDQLTKISHPWQLGECVHRDTREWREQNVGKLMDRIELFKEMINQPTVGLSEREREFAVRQIMQWGEEFFVVPPQFLLKENGEEH